MQEHPNPVEIVKRQLWRNSIRAKDVSGTGLGFDLIVNDVHRVKVIVDNGEPSIKSSLRGMIIAVVRDDSIEYQRCRGGECVPVVGLARLFA